MRVFCINNPASGRGCPNAITTKLKALADEHYQETQAISELQPLLEKWQMGEHDLLIISGGDGTFHSVLSVLLNQTATQDKFKIPILALIPAGTTNLSALDLHGRINANTALHRLDYRLHQDPINWPIVHRSLIRVQLGDSRPDQFGFVFGIGAIAQGVVYFRQKTKRLKAGQEWGALLAAIRTGLGLISKERGFIQPLQIRRALDDKPDRAFNCSLALASTLERTLFRLRYHWGKQTGPIRYIEFSENPPKLLRTLFGLFRGKMPPWVQTSEHYYSDCFKRMHLNFSGCFILDGEVMQTSAAALILSASQPVQLLQLSAAIPAK